MQQAALFVVDPADSTRFIPVVADASGNLTSAVNAATSAVVASAARTADGNSSDLTNSSAKGVTLFVNVSAISGVGATLLLKAQVKDSVSGGYVDVPGAVTAAIIATGLAMITIYPGLLAAANSVVNMPLPRDWRLAWTISGTTPSITFSVGAAYLK